MDPIDPATLDNPEKLSIPQLKSKLSEAGVDLPVTAERKSVYVELYRKHIHILGLKPAAPQQQPTAVVTEPVLSSAYSNLAGPTSSASTSTSASATSQPGTSTNKSTHVRATQAQKLARSGQKRRRLPPENVDTTAPTAAIPNTAVDANPASTTANTDEFFEEDPAPHQRGKRYRVDSTSTAVPTTTTTTAVPITTISTIPTNSIPAALRTSASEPTAQPSNVPTTSTTMTSAPDLVLVPLRVLTPTPMPPPSSTSTSTESSQMASTSSKVTSTSAYNRKSTGTGKSVTNAAPSSQRRSTMVGTLPSSSPYVNPQLFENVRYNTPITSAAAAATAAATAATTTATTPITTTTTTAATTTAIELSTPATSLASPLTVDTTRQTLLSPSDSSSMSRMQTSPFASPRSPSLASTKQPRGPVYQFGTNLLMFSAWILILVVVWLAVKLPFLTPTPIRYCDTDGVDFLINVDKEHYCEPCPNHGYCADGKLLECSEHFILKNSICIEDEEVSKAASSAVEVLQHHLSRKAGRYLCGEDAHLGETLFDVQALLNRSPVAKLVPENKFQACIDRTLAMIHESPHFNITTVEVNVAQLSPPNGENVSLAQWPPAVSSDPELQGVFAAQIHAASNVIVLYSRDPVLPLACRFKNKVLENMLYIYACGAMLVIILAANVWKNRVQTRNRQVAQLVKEVSNRLKRCVPSSSTIVHLRDELRETHENIRDIDVLKLWPLVEERIRQDTRISEAIGDSNEPVWQWVGPISTFQTPQRLTFSPDGVISPPQQY